MAATPNSEPPLIQPMSLMPPPPAPPQAQASGKAEDAAGAARAARSETQDRLESPAKPEAQHKPAGGEKDPMRDLLDRLERLAPATGDTVLMRTVQGLSQRGGDQEQLTQPSFRHNVAYALQDVEKTLGRQELPPALRSEMTQLAGTAVGLTNERMLALMASTASIQDRSLVTEIRERGRELGVRADQNSPAINSAIEVLENKTRLATRPPEPEARGPDIETRRPNGAPSLSREEHDAGAGLTNGTRVNGSLNGSPNQQNNNQGQVTIQHSVLDTLLRGMRPDGNQPQPPWEPPATPVADRLAASERRSQTLSDDRTLASAEQRGRVALDALQGFTNTEGAAVMGKIQAAAKTEPGGLPQVLSEMRDGGRFADLRKQFGNALSDDAGFAAAYDKASGALAAYGKSRAEIEPILARRPDATAFTQRLTEMDAEIGKAAAATPSKTEGRSMMEDLAKQAGELLQRAVDSVRAAFSRAPTAGAAASSSPSPGP
jgi:hypothetical protein